MTYLHTKTAFFQSVFFHSVFLQSVFCKVYFCEFYVPGFMRLLSFASLFQTTNDNLHFGLVCNKFCSRIVPGSVASWMQPVVKDERDGWKYIYKEAGAGTPAKEPQTKPDKPNRIMTREATNIDQYGRPGSK